MTTVMITGSNGFIGQKLTRHILDTGEQYTVLGCSYSPDISDIVHPRYRFEQMDITDRGRVDAVITAYSPEVIIHSAAISGVDDCENDKIHSRNVNVRGTENLVASANRTGAHLVFLSTDFVFDGKDGPYAEEHPPAPVNYYGYTKWEAEKIVMAESCKWSVVRTILVYGFNRMMKRTHMVLWLYESLIKGNTVRVVNDQYRMPTLAEDLTGAIGTIIRLGRQGVFHISGKDLVDLYTFACMVAEVFMLDRRLIIPVSTASLNEKCARPLRTGFVLNKAMNELNYQPVPVMQGLALVRQQMQNAGKG